MALNVSKGCYFDPENSLSEQEIKALMILSVVSSILAITGNGTFLFVVYKKESFHSTSNFFLCSLAVADLLVGLVVNPLRTLFLGINFWTSTSTNMVKKSNDFLACQLRVATSFNLCAVSMDRLVAVKWPLRYPTIMTPTITRRVITFVWLFSFASGIPMLVFSEATTTCIYWLFISLLTLFIPFFVILYSYTAIMKIAKEKLKLIIVPQISMSPHPSSASTSGSSFKTNSTSKYGKNRKAVATFLIIISVFCVCFVPNGICSVLCVIQYENCPAFAQTLINKWEWYISLLLATSFFNPLLYGLRNRQFRKVLYSLVSK